MGFAVLNPSYKLSVGWVERSETHRLTAPPSPPCTRPAMAAGETAATASAARPTDRTTIAASHRSHRPAAAARPGRSRADRPGSGSGCACAPHGHTTAASAAARTRSPRTSSQSCRLIAGLIRMRSTSGRLAARCSSVIASGVQRAGSTPRRSARTRLGSSTVSRSAAVSARFGRTSRPTSTSRPS